MEAPTTKKRRQKITAQESLVIIPQLEYLTLDQAVLYMGRSHEWLYKTLKDFNVQKTPFTGYYHKKDLD